MVASYLNENYNSLVQPFIVIRTGGIILFPLEGRNFSSSPEHTQYI